jgi:hypothetical protein
MRKTILLSLLGSSILFSNISAQEKKSKKSNQITPFTEVLAGVGICGESNVFSFIGGIEKPVAKHLTVSADVHYWKTDYETYCCDVYSKGTYSSVIPSIKMKFDPGKRNKGVFAGIGLGYVFAKDRGTEQPYSVETGVTGKDITYGNWDFNRIAPSFSWGVGFKISRYPVALTNTNYFANTPWGFGSISSGIGLRVSFKRDAAKCKVEKKKSSKCVEKRRCN